MGTLGSRLGRSDLVVGVGRVVFLGCVGEFLPSVERGRVDVQHGVLGIHLREFVFLRSSINLTRIENVRARDEN